MTFLQKLPTEKASTHEPRWRDLDCAADHGLSDFEKYLGRPAVAELDAGTFEDFLRTWTWGPKKAAPKNAYAATPSELDAGLLYYAADSRPVYLWNQPVVYTLRGRQAEWVARHGDKLVPVYYWRRDAASNRTVRLKTV